MTAAFVWASCRGDAQERRAEDNSEISTQSSRLLSRKNTAVNVSLQRDATPQSFWG
jgi:hypothetical protein